MRPVNYELPHRQLVSLILLSGHCEQYIRLAVEKIRDLFNQRYDKGMEKIRYQSDSRYDCKKAPLNSGNESNAWWTDR